MKQKVLMSSVFLLLCLTTQGQELLRYEVTPARPLQVPNSSQQQSLYQQQQPKKEQEQTTRIIGYYYEQDTPVWGSPATYSVRKVSLKVKIINSYNGEIYQVTAYKTHDNDSWKTPYGSNVYYDRDEGAYCVNLGTYKAYFDI